MNTSTNTTTTNNNNKTYVQQPSDSKLARMDNSMMNIMNQPSINFDDELKSFGIPPKGRKRRTLERSKTGG